MAGRKEENLISNTKPVASSTIFHSVIQFLHEDGFALSYTRYKLKYLSNYSTVHVTKVIRIPASVYTALHNVDAMNASDEL